jgi:hypothetical protein
MGSNNVKGALLEYIVRNLLKSCGFTNAIPDNLYTYESGGLFYINGRGAAHDADVIMNPPIQMPFSYPSQIIFECKAYGTSGSLTLVRNAFGLRNDLNEFEIVTTDTLRRRRNNRRANYAIETRRRYVYQVGVASINDFTKPAIEFASNNKIPLLSLSWFLGDSLLQDLNSVNQELIDTMPLQAVQNLHKFLKDRNGELNHPRYNAAQQLLNEDNRLGDIVTFANTMINTAFVGALETGDLIFLFQISRNNILSQLDRFTELLAEIHWNDPNRNVWRLEIYDPAESNRRSTYEFHLPKRIFSNWAEFNLNRDRALDIKARFFSKIFVFTRRQPTGIPFSIIDIDPEWLRRARENLANEQ